MAAYKTLCLNDKDNIAVALSNIPGHTVVRVQRKAEMISVELEQDIAFGHKFAIQTIRQGEPIIKYGEVIGKATRNIRAGEHVHVHNLEGTRGRGDKIERK
ncbi:MAG: UxaA family hydrolase [Bacillaceae bacterium]|nr:UxaA family hydrolase [Bacillaceae bacterium]